MRMKKFFIPFLAILLAACNQNTKTEITSTASTVTSIPLPGPVPNTIMTEQYVKSIGQYAFLWGWPMVNIHNRNTVFAKLPAPGYMGGIVPVAPANQIRMLTD